MILTFEFRADPERWRIHVPETGFTRDDPNRMAFNARGLVVSLGDHGRHVGMDEARVVPIYDPVGFDPVVTAGAVFFFTSFAHWKVRRGLSHVLDLFDRYDLVLELPDYSEIPSRLRAASRRSSTT